MYGWCWNPQVLASDAGEVAPGDRRVGTLRYEDGIVPLHPLDKSGKTPVNLGKGVYPVQGREIEQPLALTSTEKWSVVKRAPRETLTSGLVASAAPPRVSRTMYAGNTTGRAATPVVGSSITYDPQEHRFVNANNPPNRANGAIASNEVKTPTAIVGNDLPPNARAIQPANTPSTPAVPQASLPPRPAMTPPPAHTSGVAPHGPVPALRVEELGEAVAAREVLPAPRLPLHRIHREAAGAGARIRTNRFGDRAALWRASPRPRKTHIPLLCSAQSLLHARQANVIPA